MTLAYDWFTSTTRNVKTTVESWGCGSDSVDGFVQDYNVRLKNVFIVLLGYAGAYGTPVNFVEAP
ncbi:MAG: hypothetical protein JNL21_32030 [Myxococcales bacterium]|nr:hypothetical protein [Myxococcales bacterium]